MGNLRGLCESAKQGKLCCDDLCHGDPDNTLCGFDRSFYEEIAEEYHPHWMSDDFDDYDREDA